MALVGHGFGPAFGRVGTLRVRDGDGVDVTATLGQRQRQAPAEADLLAQRSILAGPQDDEFADTGRGWGDGVAARRSRERA